MLFGRGAQEAPQMDPVLTFPWLLIEKAPLKLSTRASSTLLEYVATKRTALTQTCLCK